MVTGIRKVFNRLSLTLFMKDDSFKVLLKNIVTSIIGANGIGVVDLLYGKKNVNEFLIAKKLGATINQTRNILYKLADEGLVSFVRKKDSKKGGWYTYFWTLNSGKSLIKFKETLTKNISDLEANLNARKAGRFYRCDNCHLEFNEENALLHNYSCPECGEVLNVKDTSEEVKGFEKDISKLKDVLNKVQLEISVLTEKDDKARVRRIKLELSKKVKERAAKKALKAKENKKLLKKDGKAVKKSSKKRI